MEIAPTPSGRAKRLAPLSLRVETTTSISDLMIGIQYRTFSLRSMLSLRSCGDLEAGALLDRLLELVLPQPAEDFLSGARGDRDLDLREALAEDGGLEQVVLVAESQVLLGGHAARRRRGVAGDAD